MPCVSRTAQFLFASMRGFVFLASLDKIDAEQNRAKRGEREIELTTKEYALLEYLLRNVRRPLSRTLIRESIWGYD